MISVVSCLNEFSSYLIWTVIIAFIIYDLVWRDPEHNKKLGMALGFLVVNFYTSATGGKTVYDYMLLSPEEYQSLIEFIDTWPINPSVLRGPVWEKHQDDNILLIAFGKVMFWFINLVAICVGYFINFRKLWRWWKNRKKPE